MVAQKYSSQDTTIGALQTNLEKVEVQKVNLEKCLAKLEETLEQEKLIHSSQSSDMQGLESGWSCLRKLDDHWLLIFKFGLKFASVFYLKDYLKF